MRQKIVAGNWKMNTTVQEGTELTNNIIKAKKDLNNNDVKTILIPPFTHLTKISELIENTDILLGAQNVASEESGAFTGEISASMIKSTGAEYVIIGHSERRAYYHEDNQILNVKIKLALKNDLLPIYCVGEKLEEREAGKHFEVIEKQLQEALFELSENEISKITIAYEPVWAIGTGKTASPEQAQEVHAFIRSKLAEKYNSQTAENISILYGGSVKPSNAKEIFAKQDVDGGLIGGASLKAEDFIQIVDAF